MCPLELVSRWASRMGTLRPLPRWARAGWAALAGYVVLQIVVAGFETHRTPFYTCSRFTPLRLARVSGVICDPCQTRDCVPACPSRLRPDDPEKGTSCLTCLECVKACPESNIGFGLAGARVQDQALSPAAAVFVFLAGGLSRTICSPRRPRRTGSFTLYRNGSPM